MSDTIATRFIHADNIAGMATLAAEGVRPALIYMDPPFFTGRDFKMGGEVAFSDRWSSLNAYVNALRLRCVVARDLLLAEGSLVVHIDSTVGAYVRVMLDGLFGIACFADEIVWRYRRWPSPRRGCQRMHDTLYRYVRDPKAESRWTQLYEPLAPSTAATWGEGAQKAVMSKGRRARSVSTAARSPGAAMSDVWDIGVIAPSSHERTGYPTQKPEKLLERLILATTHKGDTVLDPYCGSGTTVAVAARLGRLGIGIDASPIAARVVSERLALVSGSGEHGRKIDPIWGPT